jgi:hypothetical protein
MRVSDARGLQVAALGEQHGALCATLAQLRAAAAAPAADSDPAMPLAGDAPGPAEVVALQDAHAVLDAVAVWRPERVAPTELRLALPSGRALHVVLSAAGSVSAAYMRDAPGAPPRGAFEEALWAASGAAAVVQVPKPHTPPLPPVLTGHVSSLAPY